MRTQVFSHTKRWHCGRPSLTVPREQELEKDIRDAIFLALRILAECAVDEANYDLSIPWISTLTSAHSATFRKKDISWSGFLQDKRDIATFGFLVKKCLSLKEDGGRLCGHDPGKPVLQNSIRINRKV